MAYYVVSMVKSQKLFLFNHWLQNEKLYLQRISLRENLTCLIFYQAAATKLDLPDDLVGYFSLFLVREGVDGNLTCELQNIPLQKSRKKKKKHYMYLNTQSIAKIWWK